MPVGIQRLNAKKSQPNPRIIFIKPLKGPDEEIALDFLERIAAQCLPIMKEHTLSVMSLEEYEPNREFVGRNFNAGEVIQLVLKSPSTGRWLPFNYVQMVMMHELAHCKQMNHSKAFWAVRNNYAEQMRILWNRSYTGEGLWGRGALLSTGKFERNTVGADEALLEHTCGGTYRSRRKRKAKQQLSYKEQKEKRILKRFGPNGQSLGEDEDAKAELEKGRRVRAKPRVAGSNRGRELRAAAALARFDQQAKTAKEEEKLKEEGERTIKIEDDDETASGSDSETASDAEPEPASVDINGQKLVDEKGRNLIKVCEDENPNDLDAQNEMRELLQSSKVQSKMTLGSAARNVGGGGGGSSKPQITIHRKPKDTISTLRPEVKEEASEVKDTPSQSKTKKETPKSEPIFVDLDFHDELDQPRQKFNSNADRSTCSMCSFSNEPSARICAVCSHVLDPGRDPRAWKCQSAACKGGKYVNAGDSGVCGLCGERKFQ